MKIILISNTVINLKKVKNKYLKIIKLFPKKDYEYYIPIYDGIYAL